MNYSTILSFYLVWLLVALFYFDVWFLLEDYLFYGCAFDLLFDVFSFFKIELITFLVEDAD